MKNKNLLLMGSGTCLLFMLFFGCGERTGQKEYNKALASRKAGELSRAQGQMEKAILLYYEMMGWDEHGVPRPATLYDHHLEWTLAG